jgi:hypothetical protein
MMFNNQNDGINVNGVFRAFSTAHFPAKKTLFDFGLVAMIWAENGCFTGYETQIKLPRTRFRFTNLISNKQAEFGIDFADPLHDNPLTLDDVLASIKDNEEEDPLITELKQVQEAKGLLGDWFKAGDEEIDQDYHKVDRTHQEEEEGPRPGTPRIKEEESIPGLI